SAVMNAPAMVTGIIVRRDTLRTEILAAGQAVALRQAVLVAQNPGRVTQVPVQDGQAVRSGAVLASIDPGEYEIAVAVARARVRSAEAEFRGMTLFDERITDVSLRAERAAIARVKSGLENAELDLEKAKLERNRATVVAPFDGRVVNVK